MAQSAYDFSLFEKYDYGTAAPELIPEYRPEEPVKFPAPEKRSSVKSKKQSFIYVKKSTKASILKSVVAIAGAVIILSFMFGVMSINATMDEIAIEISALEDEIDIARNEQIKLNSQISNKVSYNKIKDYAENTLGMIPIESSKITYIETETENYVALSGGKSYRSDTAN